MMSTKCSEHPFNYGQSNVRTQQNGDTEKINYHQTPVDSTTKLLSQYENIKNKNISIDGSHDVLSKLFKKHSDTRDQILTKMVEFKYARSGFLIRHGSAKEQEEILMEIKNLLPEPERDTNFNHIMNIMKHRGAIKSGVPEQIKILLCVANVDNPIKPNTTSTRIDQQKLQDFFDNHCSIKDFKHVTHHCFNNSTTKHSPSPTQEQRADHIESTKKFLMERL